MNATASENLPEPSACLEIARFKAELTPEFIAARAAAMTAIAATVSGFVSSRLITFDDGSLADEVVWASREAADQGAELAPTVPQAAAYFGLITELISMEHAAIVAA